jgi:transcriptional regulator with XRE-family HTH domain
VQPVNGPEKTFGASLREIRKESGMSQERLALEAGFERTYVSLIERGLKSPTIRAVVRLAQALKVKPSLIVERMERLLAGAGQDKEKTARRRPTKAPS